MMNFQMDSSTVTSPYFLKWKINKQWSMLDVFHSMCWTHYEWKLKAPIVGKFFDRYSIIMVHQLLAKLHLQPRVSSIASKEWEHVSSRHSKMWVCEIARSILGYKVKKKFEGMKFNDILNSSPKLPPFTAYFMKNIREELL